MLLYASIYIEEGMMMNEKRYSALTIARYTINKCNEMNKPISNLKLQKLLYYIQAVFLCINKRVCYNDTIEAWAFGPVIPTVYNEFKIYGSNNIPKVEYYFDDDPESPTFYSKVKFKDDVIEQEDKDLIDGTLNLYCKYTAAQLVEMTHNEDPWKDIYKRGERNLIITVESMKKYYKNHYTRN